MRFRLDDRSEGQAPSARAKQPDSERPDSANLANIRRLPSVDSIPSASNVSRNSGEGHKPVLEEKDALSGTWASAWVYPELPWGAPPSWERHGKFGGVFLVYWEMLTCIACVYVAITVPYIVGIDEVKGELSFFGECVILQIAELSNHSWQAYIAMMDLVCDCLFVLDLVLNFHTARWQISHDGREHWALIDDLPTIRQCYLWSANADGKLTWMPGAFFVDLLGVIPWQYVDCFGALPALKTLRLLRLIKLSRLYRLRRLIEGLHYKFPTSVFAITCVELVLTMFLAAHWLCCIWFRVGYHEGWVHSANAQLMDDDGNPMDDRQQVYEWVTALYWAITTMTTIGYGDISATTQSERAVACVVMIMGCGFFAWSTGTITSVLTTRAACKVRFTDKLEELTEFMTARALPVELRHKIRGFYMLKFPTMKIFDEELILADLPLGLANEVRVELFRDVVHMCVLFQSMDTATCNEICVRLDSQYKTEGVQITCQGEYPEALYIVRFGTVSICVNDVPIMEAQCGDLFGENAMLGLTPDGQRNRSAFAKTMCEVCMLRKKDFHALLKLEGFRRPFSTLVHMHISTLDNDASEDMTQYRRYCVNWRKVASIQKRRLSQRFHEDNAINAGFDRVPSLDRRPSENKLSTPLSKSSNTENVGSVLRTQGTLTMTSLTLSSEEVESFQATMDDAQTVNNVVLAYYWRGEQRGSLWAPLLQWSDPFKIDWTAFGPEEEGGVRRIHLNQIVTFVFKHYTCDWQGLPPFKVIMYSVKDPVHFIPLLTLPERKVHSIDPDAANLQFLASGSVAIRDLISRRKTSNQSPNKQRSLGAILIRDQRTRGMLLRLKGPLGSHFQPTIDMSLSVFRILPQQSLWRRLIEILKRRGASRFFKKRQQQVIADMRISFDRILETARDCQPKYQSTEETIAQLAKSVENIMKSVDKMQSQIDGVAHHVFRQERTLNDLSDVTREIATSLRCESSLGKLRGSQMSHAQTRPMLANSTPDGGTPHVSTSPPYPVQESAHKRPVEPPVTTTPQKQMPRKPVSYDATHADQSVQAILERRSLLLSPKSAWNALVKAEASLTANNIKFTASTEPSSEPDPAPANDKAENGDGTGVGTNGGEDARGAAQV